MVHRSSNRSLWRFNAKTNTIYCDMVRKQIILTKMDLVDLYDLGRKAVEKDESAETCLENVEYPYHTVSGYRAMTQRKKKTRPPLPSVQFYVKELKRGEKEKILKNMERLQNDIITQRDYLQQITKALTYCCSSENSRVSLERVECERLLLLALHKYRGGTKKVEKLKTDIRNGCLLKAEKGSVTISNLMINFHPSLCSQIQQEEKNTWVLCLLSHEETVMATEVQWLKKDLRVEFQNTFSFSNLHNDFKINVQVFSLSLKKRSSISKQYFKRLLPKLMVRSQRIQSPHDLLNSPILSRQAIFKTPDFYLRGSFFINLENLKSSLIWKEFPFGQVHMSLKWDVESKVDTSGFLTVREEIGESFMWDRRWCFLEGCRLKLWNYPADKDNLPPLKVLDLRQCVYAKVIPLDTSICSRPRTFLLEIAQKQDESQSKTIKYMFSTDTNKDLLQWCMVLTKNLELLKEWKIIN